MKWKEERLFCITVYTDVHQKFSTISTACCFTPKLGSLLFTAPLNFYLLNRFICYLFFTFVLVFFLRYHHFFISNISSFQYRVLISTLTCLNWEPGIPVKNTGTKVEYRYVYRYAFPYRYTALGPILFKALGWLLGYQVLHEIHVSAALSNFTWHGRVERIHTVWSQNVGPCFDTWGPAGVRSCWRAQYINQ